MAAFRRFVARRGRPLEMWSDQGTNFKGAANLLLAQVEKNLADEEGIDFYWHFNPAAAPNFGGLWEAMVKKVKFHLKRTLGGMSLTFEEYYTILCQIEAVINSRPLCRLNPNEFSALTPAHLLVGDSLAAFP
jgi:hypothetical protein